MKKKYVFFIFCLLLKAGQHAKAGRLPEGVPQICLSLGKDTYPHVETTAYSAEAADVSLC